MTLEIVSSNKSFGGWHKRYRHRSSSLNCDMVFAVYLPPQAEQGASLPVLYWLSGLTCTDENFMQKAGAQRMAAELGLVIVAPDTSPRGPEVPDDAEGAWDFGLGAGFYLNATQQPWARHYQMHDYVVHELPALVEAAARPADMTVAAIVGCAGLAPVMAAVERGGTIALANKEALVSAGEVLMQAVAKHGATLLPTDSEHNAIFQCLNGKLRMGIR